MVRLIAKPRGSAPWVIDVMASSAEIHVVAGFFTGLGFVCDSGATDSVVVNLPASALFPDDTVEPVKADIRNTHPLGDAVTEEVNCLIP